MGGGRRRIGERCDWKKGGGRGTIVGGRGEGDEWRIKRKGGV